MRQHTPEVAPHLGALQEGNVERFFSAVTPVSIDVGVLERSRNVAVVSGAFAFSTGEVINVDGGYHLRRL